MKYVVELNAEEREIIQSVAKLQLDSLKAIITNDMEEDDLILHCLENDLDTDELLLELRKNYVIFRDLMNEPHNITSLDEDNLSIAKTLMFKFFDSDRYETGRSGIYRKLMFANFYPILDN